MTETIEQFVYKLINHHHEQKDIYQVDWQGKLRDRGYYSVQTGSNAGSNWQECHNWCKKNIGADHYTWHGSIFWFDTEQAAILFLLRWA